MQKPKKRTFTAPTTLAKSSSDSPIPLTTHKVFAGLDSLRGIAALCVVFFHVPFATLFTHCNFVKNANLMVDFFFVLSGFVIVHNYGDRLTSAKHLWGFMLTRFGRLYPLHLVMLLVIVGVEIAKYLAASAGHAIFVDDFFHESSRNTLEAFFTNLLLIQSLGFHDWTNFNRPSWSVSAELYTYLLFAWITVTYHNMGKIVGWLISPILSLAALGFLYIQLGQILTFTEFGFIRCCGGFFLGVFTYQFYTLLALQKLNQQAVTAMATLSLLTTTVLMTFSLSGEAQFLFPPLFSAIVLTVALLEPMSILDKGLRLRPLLWLGQKSYSIYLIHLPLQLLFQQGMLHYYDLTRSWELRKDAFKVQGTIVFAISCVVLLILCQFSYTYIENRYRIRIKRFAQRFYA